MQESENLISVERETIPTLEELKKKADYFFFLCDQFEQNQGVQE